MRALFFQLDNSRSFVLWIIRNAILSQYNKGWVVLLIPSLDLNNAIEYLGPPDLMDQITLPHMTESRRKLGSCGFAL